MFPRIGVLAVTSNTVDKADLAEDIDEAISIDGVVWDAYLRD